MTTKHYLATILFFTLIFLFAFSANAQNSSDTISIIKNRFDTDYYQEGRILNLDQLMNVVKENKVAYSLMKEAYALYVTGIVFDVAGGFFLGTSVGYAIGCAIRENLVNLKVLIPLLSVSTGFIVCGITCEIVSKNKIHKGVCVYNYSKKHTQSTSLDLGFSPNGVNVRLNF
jgi:uncharacterized membrane protein (Fun14 family)